jgi:hypothetical protein
MIIDVDDLSGYVGRDVSADDGAVICVDSACAMVQTLTEQDFEAATDTVTLDGTGTDTLLLPQLPVNSAGTVVVNGGTLNSTDYGVGADGRLVRTGGTAVWSTWGQTSAPSAYWPRGRQNISVTYTHGYAGTVPSDVRRVALELAHRMFTQGGAISETVGQVTKRYAVASTDLTNGEKAILRMHRVT